jgi:ABC-type transport system involved in multi-copper enzyme maturation permease subunit
MSILLAIALNTFKETIRNRILYAVLLFAAVVIMLSVSFGEWSVFARARVMQDFGLASMSIAGLLLAVFIGVGMLGREISTGTVHVLASKPVHRHTILLGKFAGLMGSLLLTVGIMAAAFLLMLWSQGGSPAPSIVWAIVLTWLEMALMVSVALFFSTFASPMLAAMLTLGFYLVGHFNDLMDVASVQGNTVFSLLLRMIYFALPNLEHFNVRSRIVYELPVSGEYFGFAVLYGLLFTALFLLLSCWIFSRKDL